MFFIEKITKYAFFSGEQSVFEQQNIQNITMIRGGGHFALSTSNKKIIIACVWAEGPMFLIISHFFNVGKKCHDISREKSTFYQNPADF